ncbi:hypothetical protein GCM10012284_59810 [Mangrovihabitans endophyticus]|uniref:Uncharacterized protein n=1 Tax=Mangrovihabitans endophyticus TaxID=1751298 RepID=A0A8J3FRJ6_9ACTN|nr:hypothetical protein GCM10012284_59810 [Mangrovihabitans endophyticus]
MAGAFIYLDMGGAPVAEQPGPVIIGDRGGMLSCLFERIHGLSGKAQGRVRLGLLGGAILARAAADSRGPAALASSSRRRPVMMSPSAWISVEAPECRLLSKIRATAARRMSPDRSARVRA